VTSNVTTLWRYTNLFTIIIIIIIIIIINVSSVMSLLLTHTERQIKRNTDLIEDSCRRDEMTD